MSRMRSFFRSVASIDWAFVFFIVALCGAAFSYGAAVMAKKIFPYQIIEHAKLAYEAFTKMEDEDQVASVVGVDEKAILGFHATKLDARAGNELLLIPGGPDRDHEHCPKYGCLAWVVDRSGKVVYSWPLDAQGLFGDVKGFSGSTRLGNFYPVGLQLEDDGTLLVTFHGRNMFPYAVGMAHIGKKGEILWKQLESSHHWFRLAPDGMIYSPVQIQRKDLKYLPGTKLEVKCDVPVYDDGIRIRRPDGTVARTISVLNVIAKSGYAGLLYGIRNDCDPTHLNSVDVVTPDIATKLPGVSAGDFLVSLRELSAVAILDQSDGHIKKLVSGRSAAQHSAHFLPDGRVIVFDNRGGASETGGSRVAVIDLNSGETHTVFPQADAKPLLPFYSSVGGQVQASPDGKRIMVTSLEESRNFEIDLATGRPLWLMTQAHDTAPFHSDDSHPKPVKTKFNTYGAYYVTPAQAQGLGLNR